MTACAVVRTNQASAGTGARVGRSAPIGTAGWRWSAAGAVLLVAAVACCPPAGAAPLLLHGHPQVPCDQEATWGLSGADLENATIGLGDGVYQEEDLLALWFRDGAVLLGDTIGHARGEVVGETFLDLREDSVLDWGLGFVDPDDNAVRDPTEPLILSARATVSAGAIRLDGGIRPASPGLEGIPLTPVNASLLVATETTSNNTTTDLSVALTLGGQAFLDMDGSGNLTTGDLDLRNGTAITVEPRSPERPVVVRTWRLAYQDRSAPAAQGGPVDASQARFNISSAWDGRSLGLVAWDTTGYSEVIPWQVSCKEAEPVLVSSVVRTGWGDMTLLGSAAGAAALAGLSTVGAQRMRRPRTPSGMGIQIRSWSVTADVEDARADGATICTAGRPEPLPEPMRELLQSCLDGDTDARDDLSRALLVHLERSETGDTSIDLRWDAITTTVTVIAEARWRGARHELEWTQAGNAQEWEIRWEIPRPYDLDALRRSIDDFCQRARTPIEQFTIQSGG